MLTPYYQDSAVTLFNEDNLIVLHDTSDNSVDSIVTDPPYGISFMGKKWDYDVPPVELWREALRVLKPGGHALVACGTRTQHRMAVNLEDAGFEIRDIVAWVYGSGFPKSLDISKAIDKQAGIKRVILGEDKAYIRKGNRANANFGSNGKSGLYANEESHKFLTVPATPAARQWQGWGTALKPAMELWTLCRKPLAENTVAENVLKYGTGGINVDGCRVKCGDNLYREPSECSESKDKGTNFNTCHKTGSQNDNWKQGRFPANFIHDGSEEVVMMFPSSSSSSYRPPDKGGTGNTLVFKHDEAGIRGHDDFGNNARFFYTAKASKSERNDGLYEFEEERHADRNIADGVGGGNPRNRTNTPKKNYHPTVKPVSLMRYLCRLITPPNGTVADLFMGSGSTGIAAKLEGFNFIGMEKELEYCRIAENRIKSESNIRQEVLPL
jgi:DNA modification methylase